LSTTLATLRSRDDRSPGRGANSPARARDLAGENLLEEVNRVQAVAAGGDTRELMRRDKEGKKGSDSTHIHRTKLDRIHQLEASVCQDVLKEVCIELGTANIAEIMPAMRKITRIL